MQYTRQAKKVILEAANAAKQLGHSYIGSVHILLALLRQPGLPGRLLKFAGLEKSYAELVVTILYGAGESGLPLPQSFSRQARRILYFAAKEARCNGSRQRAAPIKRQAPCQPEHGKSGGWNKIPG